jgi:hypothetical protein
MPKAADAIQRYRDAPDRQSAAVAIPEDHIQEALSRNGEVDRFQRGLEHQVQKALEGSEARSLLPNVSIDPDKPFEAHVVRERSVQLETHGVLGDDLFNTYGKSTFRFEGELLYTPGEDGGGGAVTFTGTVTMRDIYDWDPDTSWLTNALDSEIHRPVNPSSTYGQEGSLDLSFSFEVKMSPREPVVVPPSQTKLDEPASSASGGED